MAGEGEHDLGWMLGSLLRAHRAGMTALLADLPHGARGYQTLREVARGRHTSQLALARHLGIDRTVMTYLLDDLVAAGLVERQENPADRRQRLVVATDEGVATIADLCSRVRAVEDETLAGLPVPERETFRALLDRAAGAVTETFDPCGEDEAAPSQSVPKMSARS